MRIRKLGCLFVALAATFSSAFAWSTAPLNNFDISVAAGPSWYHANNGYLTSSDGEIDTAFINNASKTGIYRAGIGYHPFSTTLSQRTFLNDLLIQLNIYHSSSTIKGQTAAFGDPVNNNDWTFRAPLSSMQLILNLKPTLFTFHGISPYLISGVGVAWNRISYYENPAISDAAPYSLNLAGKTNRNLVYETGFGIQETITKNLSASIEYINEHLGRVAPSTNSTVNSTSIVSAPNFPLTNQSVLLGLNWRFSTAGSTTN